MLIWSSVKANIFSLSQNIISHPKLKHKAYLVLDQLQHLFYPCLFVSVCDLNRIPPELEISQLR